MPVLEKYALQHKNICKTPEMVVILHPQSGTEPRRLPGSDRRTLTTMPQDNDRDVDTFRAIQTETRRQMKSPVNQVTGKPT